MDFKPGGETMTRLIGLSMLLMGAAGYAFAGAVITVPEIDASSAVGALALLSGGLLVLRSRRRKN
jgi:LPXTG-motif cell wall-anchored protein